MTGRHGGPPMTVTRYRANPVPLVRALTQRRLHLGLTQADVAQHMGVNTSMISRFERSLHPNLTTVQRYADAVDADLHVVARRRR